MSYPRKAQAAAIRHINERVAAGSTMVLACRKYQLMQLNKDGSGVVGSLELRLDRVSAGDVASYIRGNIPNGQLAKWAEVLSARFPSRAVMTVVRRDRSPWGTHPSHAPMQAAEGRQVRWQSVTAPRCLL